MKALRHAQGECLTHINAQGELDLNTQGEFSKRFVMRSNSEKSGSSLHCSAKSGSSLHLSVKKAVRPYTDIHLIIFLADLERIIMANHMPFFNTKDVLTLAGVVAAVILPKLFFDVEEEVIETTVETDVVTPDEEVVVTDE